MTFEDELAQNGRLVFATKGSSMQPMLRQGRDLVIIRPRPLDDCGQPVRCKKYDVALYKAGGRYILHRVVRVLPDCYTFCGDHNLRKEYGIQDAQILGVLTAFVRKGVEIPVTNRAYRLYVRLWRAAYPLRAAAIWVKSKI